MSRWMRRGSSRWERLERRYSDSLLVKSEYEKPGSGGQSYPFLEAKMEDPGALWGGAIRVETEICQTRAGFRSFHKKEGFSK